MGIKKHIVTARVRRTSDACCFANDEFNLEFNEGSLVWLKGPSGAGKTLTILHMLDVQKSEGMDISVTWNPEIRPSERAGILFQQGVLVDSLNVYENIALSLTSAGADSSPSSVKKYIEMVGLKVTDLSKMPNELSGGMLRRASLAQLLAQQKKLIALDEPFIGLDPATALGIVEELKRIQASSGTALLLISHEEDIANKLIPDPKDWVHIRPRSVRDDGRQARQSHTFWSVRTAVKLWDYFCLSLPVIIAAFIASGFAISMLFADVLSRTDVSDQILQVIDVEFGGSDSPFRAMVPVMKSTVKRVVDEYSPDIKASLYSFGIARLFVLELGPLLTALLLAGRIGGSYAGEIATMQATNQNRLLRTLGISPVRWTLLPALLAALLAAPVLTLIGTVIALHIGAITIDMYDLSDREGYWEDVNEAVWAKDTVWQTYPPYVLVYRSLSFMLIIMLLAEVCGRWNPFLQPRGVPGVITFAVVLAGVLIIVADWGFSQVLLHYGLF